MSKEEKKKLGIEMYKGCDKVYKKMMGSIEELFTVSKKNQK